MQYQQLEQEEVILEKGKINDNFYVFLHGNYKEVEEFKEEQTSSESSLTFEDMQMDDKWSFLY